MSFRIRFRRRRIDKALGRSPRSCSEWSLSPTPWQIYVWILSMGSAPWTLNFCPHLVFGIAWFRVQHHIPRFTYCLALYLAMLGHAMICRFKGRNASSELDLLFEKCTHRIFGEGKTQAVNIMGTYICKTFFGGLGESVLGILPRAYESSPTCKWDDLSYCSTFRFWVLGSDKVLILKTRSKC